VSGVERGKIVSLKVPYHKGVQKKDFFANCDPTPPPPKRRRIRPPAPGNS
jgi:hypothetical protein